MKKIIGLIAVSFLLLGASCDVATFLPYTPPAPGGLFLSRDGGQTWNELGEIGPTVANPTSKAAPTASTASTAHTKPALSNADIRQVLVDSRNPDHVYIVTKKSGVWESSDRGAHITQFLPYQALYLAQLNGQMFFALDRRIFSYNEKDKSSKTVYIHGDPAAEILRVDVTPQGKLLALVSTGEVIISGNKGESWSVVLKNSTGFTTFVQHKGILFVASSVGGLWSSTNGGATWTKISGSRVTAVAAGGAYLYVAQDGALTRSRNAGSSFEEMTLLTKDSPPIWGIAASKDDKVIYYATEAAFFTSRDGGASWKSRPLPAGRKPIILQFAPDGALYLGFHALG